MLEEPITDSQESTERDLLDRLAIRAPALAGSLSGRSLRVAPGSRFRKRLVNLQIKRAFSAMARSDVELLVLAYEPEVEVWMRSMSGVGMSECYHGHQGIRTLFADLDEAFSDWSWTASAVADGGNRLAIRADFVGCGRGSGVQTALTDGGTAIRLSPRGLVEWQEWFAEQDGWARALEAAGLTPDS